MKTSKKNLSTKTLVVLILALLLIASAVGYTVAKYISESSDQYSARVAVWDVSAKKATTSVDLFSYTSDTIDVDGNGTEKVIAPGAEGSFSYELTNDSEVAATYAVNYTAEENGVYLQYSVDGTTWTDNLTDITATEIDMGETVTKVIYWKWAFEAESTPVAAGQSDVNDTNLGIAGTATPSITIVVTFVQEN